MSEQTSAQPTTPLTTTPLTTAVVSPYRFTRDPVAMIDFLERLGLRVVIRRHDYAVLQGRGGRVAVHPVATSELGRPLTSLTLDVPDVVALTEALRAAGVEADWWDEAWGRQARIGGPTGLISVNAEMDDFHGYRTPPAGDRAAADSPVEVTAVVFGTDFDALTRLFGILGFTPDAGEGDGWRPLRGGSGAGSIGLHATDVDGLDPNGYLTAALSFETTEPLAELAERLRAAGHPVEQSTAGTVPPTDILVVTDPDGDRIEIHPAKTVPGRR